MINKKINKLLSSILGIMLSFGIMEMRALADDSVEATSSYNTNVNLTENKSYIVNKDSSIEKNGLKITIDKIVATKHKLKATVIVENEKSFDESELNNAIAQLTYGDNKCDSEGVSYEHPDEKTLRITLERNTGDEELPEKGELRIDIVLPNYKVNVGLNAYVDFSQSFKNTIEKDISAKIPEFGITLNKLESNIMGTRIIYSQPARDYSKRVENDFSNLPYSAIILKVGDKMFKTISAGGYSSADKDRLEFGSYEAECATYEKVKDQKNISIIPMVCNMNWNDTRKIYDDNKKNGYNEKREANKETINNVSYIKSFDFSDGSKGEIYNIERKDNTIKVYCKGTSDKESLLMASNMFMYYNLGDDKLGYNNIYDSRSNMSFYKDSKDAIGYIVEFNNVDKDKTVELDFEGMIKQIDKFKVGDEIQISK
ncbi:hypothetical protein psyc5s11_39150 [Clostridium gelidum]|uniref:DUF4179 domain-containing protein n=1 Tax=Clostridium gelidum TaxID=704125 RepID=A0ABN6J296_9CLOT|nr:DUF4179 domain-containing protein [Clostridium gelidum]BCZ47848.1 hypothetical protein psyc5s11_39150 [Clostridium gelidum]